jgi:hypothetical protein
MALFVPYTPPPYRFTTTLKGFLFFDKTDAQSEEEVTAIVGETLFSTTASTDTTKKVRRFIARFSNNTPSLVVDIEDILGYLRNSIVVRCLNLVKKEDIGTGEGKSHPAWNVYIFPPTKDHAALADWRTIIRNTIFVTADNGAGRTYKLFKCLVCQSVDHPTGMCSYPSHPGWTPPMSTNSPALDDLLNSTHSRDNGRNANNRGPTRGNPTTSRGRANTGRGRRNAARN